jgi:hypothetical protein
MKEAQIKYSIINYKDEEATTLPAKFLQKFINGFHTWEKAGKFSYH